MQKGIEKNRFLNKFTQNGIGRICAHEPSIVDIKSKSSEIQMCSRDHKHVTTEHSYKKNMPDLGGK